MIEFGWQGRWGGVLQVGETVTENWPEPNFLRENGRR